MTFSALAVLGIFFFGSVEGSDGALKSTQFGSPEHDENFMEAADSSYSHRQMGATIAASACVGENDCRGLGDTAIIGDNSCADPSNNFDNMCDKGGGSGGYFEVGARSCLNAGEVCSWAGISGWVKIGDDSCKNGLFGCHYAGFKGKATIGDNSCIGHYACTNLGMHYTIVNTEGVIVGSGSCTGDRACGRIGFANPQGITVGDNSCKGSHACVSVGNVESAPTPPLAEIIIGAGSCNCKNCCRCLSDGDIVADGKCNSLGNGAEECCLNENEGNNRNTVFDFSNAGGAAVNGVGGEPSSSPIEFPSLSPSFPSFSIGSAEITFEPSTTSLQITHGMGTGPDDVKVDIFSYDCTESLKDNIVSIPPTNFNEASSSFTYNVALDFSLVPSSDHVTLENNDVSVGSVNFCTQLQTQFKSSTGDTLNVTAVKYNYKVKFDLRDVTIETMNVTVDTEILEEEEEFEDDYTVLACVCSIATAICDEQAGTIEQNSRVNICLKPSSNEVKIVNFSLKLESGSTSFNPITMGGPGDSWSIADPELTSVTPVNNDVAISVFMIADLYLNGSTSVSVSGLANLGFTAARKSNYAFFQMDFPIEAVDEDSDGCLGTFLGKFFR